MSKQRRQVLTLTYNQLIITVLIVIMLQVIDLI